ncbi:MAG TPA: aminodeoxychorismate/anthranilate synthase component II [Nitratifractor sp.]|nr:aminodeoxychorismate/anthranilate synthase component II [Nitratifractor sp.]HHD74293.1 aminodeoxychorismate/anthranilate synthase component II [Nitratifractor sp.]HHH20927.1 aminodeoxychorismate/anthranilate synthase component II [Nitratifractor sp.]
MVLMIDNYDSFTYNIVQYCKELGADLKIIRNDELSIKEVKELNPQKIILSPGPSTPNEAGITLDVIKEFSDTTPILGVCLGHQSIAQAFGANVIRAKNMMHGKTSQVNQTKSTPIFNDVDKDFTATRYHSLVVERDSVPSAIEVTALSSDDEEIMALQVKGKPIYGVQFHPESIKSDFGHKIFDNFLSL